MNNCFSVIVQMFSKTVVNSVPFCYNCFDNSEKTSLISYERCTPNVIAHFVFIKIVVCSIVFISSCQILTKCKAAILKFSVPAIIPSR